MGEIMKYHVLTMTDLYLPWTLEAGAETKPVLGQFQASPRPVEAILTTQTKGGA